MIRNFEHGILCLRDNDEFVVNIFPHSVATGPFKLTACYPQNQVFVETNPLLAPRALADWRYS